MTITERPDNSGRPDRDGGPSHRRDGWFQKIAHGVTNPSPAPSTDEYDYLLAIVCEACDIGVEANQRLKTEQSQHASARRLLKRARTQFQRIRDARNDTRSQLIHANRELRSLRRSTAAEGPHQRTSRQEAFAELQKTYITELDTERQQRIQTEHQLRSVTQERDQLKEQLEQQRQRINSEHAARREAERSMHTANHELEHLKKQHQKEQAQPNVDPTAVMQVRHQYETKLKSVTEERDELAIRNAELTKEIAEIKDATDAKLQDAAELHATLVEEHRELENQLDVTEARFQLVARRNERLHEQQKSQNPPAAVEPIRTDARLESERARRRKAEKENNVNKGRLRHARRKVRYLEYRLLDSKPHAEVSYRAHSYTAQGMLRRLLPKVSYARDSVERFAKLNVPIQAFDELRNLNDTPGQIRSERIGGSQWLELRSTRSERIYFKNTGGTTPYQVLIGDKNSQRSDIEWMKKH